MPSPLYLPDYPSQISQACVRTKPPGNPCFFEDKLRYVLSTKAAQSAPSGLLFTGSRGPHASRGATSPHPPQRGPKGPPPHIHPLHLAHHPVMVSKMGRQSASWPVEPWASICRATVSDHLEPTFFRVGKDDKKSCLNQQSRCL